MRPLILASVSCIYKTFCYCTDSAVQSAPTALQVQIQAGLIESASTWRRAVPLRDTRAVPQHAARALEISARIAHNEIPRMRTGFAQRTFNYSNNNQSSIRLVWPHYHGRVNASHVAADATERDIWR